MLSIICFVILLHPLSSEFIIIYEGLNLSLLTQALVYYYSLTVNSSTIHPTIRDVKRYFMSSFI